VKDVHKVPALELVGWFTILSIDGPQSAHLPIHRQILDSYNESAILLGFHPTSVLEGNYNDGLPLTIYESNYEAEETAVTDNGEDKEMKDGEPTLKLKFRVLPYTVETGEAEMIGVSSIARGGGNATAVEASRRKEKSGESEPLDPKGKGKARASKRSDESGTTTEDLSYLSREDEEHIASLTAKINAVKMLHSRINLIKEYLERLPPSYIKDSIPENLTDTSGEYMPVDYQILRSIQALLTRLSLLVPADARAFERELLAEKNDVTLVSLLSDITNSVKEIREAGRKFSVIELARNAKSKGESNGRLWDGSSGPSGHLLGAGDLL
jgi:COP9 signalosome complex subunit 6